MLRKPCFSMANDGCQLPAWTGQAFAYLPHHPRGTALASSSYAQLKPPGMQTNAGLSTSGPAAALQEDRTGVWNGPAPVGSTGRTQNDAMTAATDAPQSEYLLLRSGAKLPLVGFGTYKVDNADSVRCAIAEGYRHIDCAAFYGNEETIGEGMADFINQGHRSDLFITSKVWNDAHRPKLVRASCERSIKDLGCEYLDLLLMHWPEAWEPESGMPGKPDHTVTIQQTWEAMEELVDSGLVRHLGVSNFSVKQVEELLECARIKPVANQVELHPFLPQRKLVGVCARKGVHCIAFSPLGHSDPGVINNDVLKEVAQELGRTSAQVCLKWNVQRGVPVIPRSQNPKNIKANIDGIFDWVLPRAAKAKLDTLDSGIRKVNAEWHDWGDVEEGGASKPSKVLA
ncbi:TPA: hypothetical protein ACH3X2_007656 [Trebouxia sp. C0005]|nr:MAG: aldo-keto reductase family 4 member C8 [Trebouxia sp. A1-2]